MAKPPRGLASALIQVATPVVVVVCIGLALGHLTIGAAPENIKKEAWLEESFTTIRADTALFVEAVNESEPTQPVGGLLDGWVVSAPASGGGDGD